MSELICPLLACFILLSPALALWTAQMMRGDYDQAPAMAATEWST